MIEHADRAPLGPQPGSALPPLDSRDAWEQPRLSRVDRLLDGLALDRLQGAEIGFGLGVTQGLAAGLLIGLVIVVTVAWSASHATASHPPLQRENHA